MVAPVVIAAAIAAGTKAIVQILEQNVGSALDAIKTEIKKSPQIQEAQESLQMAAREFLEKNADVNNFIENSITEELNRNTENLRSFTEKLENSKKAFNKTDERFEGVKELFDDFLNGDEREPPSQSKTRVLVPLDSSSTTTKPDRFGRTRRVSNTLSDVPKFIEGLGAAEEAMEDLRLVSRDALGEIDGAAKETFRRIEGFMVRSLQTGKFEWRDLASEAVGALRQILDAQLETAGASSSLFGGSGGGGGILGTLVSLGASFLGPASGGGGASSAALSTALSLSGPRFAFAHGGRPPLGVPSLVGEEGPELFIPDNHGTVVPNDRLGGGREMAMTVNVTQNFDLRGADLAAVAALRREAVRIKNEVMTEILASAHRGGVFARMARA